MTVFLATEDLLAITDELGVRAVRDVGLLDSAAHRPQATVFGEDAYPGLDDKAAALLESIVRNHPLVDGNKRLGWVATVVFYRLNGAELVAPEDDAYDLVVGVAAGQVDRPAVAAALAGWSQAVTGTDRWNSPG